MLQCQHDLHSENYIAISFLFLLTIFIDNKKFCNSLFYTN